MLSALVHNPGNSQLRQRILQLISWIILQRKVVVSYEGFESCTSNAGLEIASVYPIQDFKTSTNSLRRQLPLGKKDPEPALPGSSLSPLQLGLSSALSAPTCTHSNTLAVAVAAFTIMISARCQHFLHLHHGHSDQYIYISKT